MKHIRPRPGSHTFIQLARIIAEAFQIEDERVMDTLINRSETFVYFINRDNPELKQAA